MIQALNKNNSFESLDIYSKRSVQILINEHWHRAAVKLHFLETIPYIITIVFFTLWSNWVLKNRNEHTADESVAFAPTLYILSIYFLLIEFVLLLSHTKGYLSSFWSYIKLVPSTLLLINLSAAQDPANIDDVNFWYR